MWIELKEILCLYSDGMFKDFRIELGCFINMTCTINHLGQQNTGWGFGFTKIHGNKYTTRVFKNESEKYFLV